MQRREKIMNKMIRRFLFALLLSFPLAAHAATPAELIRELGEADFGRKSEIAIELSKADAPAAVRLMDAMIAGTLYATADGKAVIDLGDGKGYADALSGAAVTPDTYALNQIVANNRLRRELRGLSASLSLMSSDPAMRESAAEAAFSTHDAESLESVEKALAAEKDAGIRTILAQARANILLQSGSADEQQKLDSIALLVSRGDQDSINALMVVANDESPKVRDASAKGVETIQSSLSYWSFAQNLIYGLSLGSVLLLAAIGLSITFGVMGVINMAHGEMVMLGAYATFLTQEAFKAYAPAWFGWSLAAAIPIAFLTAAAIGVLIERGIIRFLYGRPLETLLATFGVSLILQQAVRTLFGPTNREVSAPSFMSGAFDLFGLSIAWGRLSIIIFTLAVFAGLLFLLKATPLGLQMRAVTQNRRMASSMGIRTAFVDSATFALGSGIAGVAGVALSQIDNVSPNLGQSYIIDSFMVVVFGGVGNLWGTLVSAFALGIGNKFLEPLAGAVLAKIAILVCLILFIQKRPSGLFALKGRAVEA